MQDEYRNYIMQLEQHDLQNTNHYYWEFLTCDDLKWTLKHLRYTQYDISIHIQNKNKHFTVTSITVSASSTFIILYIVEL